MSKQRNSLKLSLLSIILLACSCNFNQNREILVNDFLIKQVDSTSSHLFAFSNFRKIDGVEKQKGSLIYEMTFKGFVVATADCYWDGLIYGFAFFGKNKTLKMDVSTSLPELENNSNDDQGSQFSLYKKGYGITIKGIAVFEKRDSGWNLAEMRISYDDSEKLETSGDLTDKGGIDQDKNTSVNTLLVQYAVANDKAFFHNQPNVNTSQEKYLVKDNIIEQMKEEGDFVYTEFTNKENGEINKGWINKCFLIQIK